MNSRRWRLGLASIFVISGLASCGPGPADPQFNPALAGPYPADYKAIMASHVRDIYFDPHTLRDVALTVPDRGMIAGANGWVVCLKANGKNRQGAYAGRQMTGYLISNGAVVASLAEMPDCQHERWEPWPEMELAP